MKATGHSITQIAQMKALATLAIWNGICGMANMPAMTGMTARTGPMKWPRNTLHSPCSSKNASPRGMRVGCVVNGQTLWMLSLK